MPSLQYVEDVPAVAARSLEPDNTFEIPQTSPAYSTAISVERKFRSSYGYVVVDDVVVYLVDVYLVVYNDEVFVYFIDDVIVVYSIVVVLVILVLFVVFYVVVVVVFTSILCLSVVY